jgi:hypothetical protein
VDTAGNYKVMHSFTGGADGAAPYSSLVRDESGNLYGTANSGGLPGCGLNLGCGVVFKLDAAGNFSVLYSFMGGADGGGPTAGLVRDSAGNLYGATNTGGLLSCNSPDGCGVVFKYGGELQRAVHLHR